ncbi:hypothetical protein J4E90_008864 [Alternaria incomplexa]|uniref:uncharacterized protein n=1 Tax=Alternaria incomplexa TaxID=1187928 RepID=UPI002220FDDB|nr:uncharacterized protein J4E90_008864 [Alternaria incomplexa]KAI4908240.1 hypothetical protein J4E90_008864 [Alternaria incomplexa]
MAPPLTNLQYQAIFALFQSGNQVTLTQVRTALDTHVQNSSDEQFEALPGGGYKLDANTGFESSIGFFKYNWPDFWVQLHFDRIPEYLSNRHVDNPTAQNPHPT